MKFGEILANAKKRIGEIIPYDKWVEYDMLKVSIEKDDDMTFWAKWESELEKVNLYLEETLMDTKQMMSCDCGPSISCVVFKKHNIKDDLLEKLFKYVELNREGFRKIAKKHDKVKKTATPQQDLRLQTFDNRIMNAVEELETRSFFMATIPERKRSRILLAVFCILLTATITLAILQPPKNTTLLVLAAIGGFATAYSNAANDICNCVGTTVGAGVLSLRQAVLWGCVFEVLGCVVLGSQVAKEITKGIIDANNYSEDHLLYAFSMVCVLFGAASTTLLATAYGLPISATHGIIGGLVAVGMAGMGVSSIGWSTVGIVTIGWVAAPVAGGLCTFSLTILIQCLIQRHDDAIARSIKYQPLFLFVCFSVNLCFMFIKGPKFMKIKPEWLALLVALGSGVVLTVISVAVLRYISKNEKKDPQNENPQNGDVELTKNDKKELLKEPPKIPEVVQIILENNDSSGGDDSKDELPPDLASMRTLSYRTINMNTTVNQFLNERTQAKESPNPAETPFNFPLILSGLSLAFAHGGNDVGNAVGPFAAVLAVARDGEVEATPDPPFWTLLVGALAFLVGILTMGRLTIKTVGSKITKLTASKSFATQIGAAMAVMTSSALGLPVSTSHCLVGSVVGGAFASRLVGQGSVNKKVLLKILNAWLATIPLAMGIAVVCFTPFQKTFENT